MKKLNRKFKYDFIIYSCLLVSLILIGTTAYAYLSNTSYSIKDIIFERNEKVIIEEPKELTKINKKELLNNYILDLLDEIKIDKVLTFDILHSWNSYEILDILYEREITKNYHSYQVNIKINNNNALLPTVKNKDLSTDDYTVITLNMNILIDSNNNNYVVKGLDIPKNR